MKLRERTVHVYDVTLIAHSRHKDIANPNCAPIVNVLEAISKLKLIGESVVKKKTELTEIVDWTWDSTTKVLKILINRADKNVSDVTFRNFTTRVARKGGKTKDDGIEWSAHVIMAPGSNPQTVTMLLTLGAGVTAIRIINLLNLLVREIKSQGQHSRLFEFPLPSGEKELNSKKRKTYTVRYRFEYAAQQSTFLKDALNNGQFIGMELIAHEYSNFDTGGNLQIRKQSLSISPVGSKKISATRIISAVKSYIDGNQLHVYDDLKIRYSTAAGDPRVTSLKINDLEAPFTRKETIELPHDVEQRQQKLDTAIVSEMLKLL